MAAELVLIARYFGASVGRIAMSTDTAGCACTISTSAVQKPAHASSSTLRLANPPDELSTAVLSASPVAMFGSSSYAPQHALAILPMTTAEAKIKAVVAAEAAKHRLSRDIV
ncbi:hypothetical protein FOA52_009510 [Chlamydomonas sp. UWO 241]|nr:hypothetical protein FOA52_009510 [Chlamydomonas sp. UWO 241]